VAFPDRIERTVEIARILGDRPPRGPDVPSVMVMLGILAGQEAAELGEHVE
jgi:hypothetical protein